MPVTPTYPGVYIEEIPSGVRTISGVSTSITAFIGTAKRGPVNEPIRIFSFSDFERSFGGLARDSELGYAVRQFFLNGGGDAYVVRIAKGAEAASQKLKDKKGNEVLTLTAKHPGKAGNDISVEVDYQTDEPDNTFNLTLTYQAGDNPNDRTTEVFKNLSMDVEDLRFVGIVVNEESALVEITHIPEGSNLDSPLSRPASLPMPASLVSSEEINGQDSSSIPGDASKFQIAFDGNPEQVVTLELPSTDATTIAAKAEDFAKQIQNAVRALNPALLAYKNFQCVAEGRKIRLTSGSSAPGSTMTISAVEGDTLLQKLKLLEQQETTKTVTSEQAPQLAGGAEEPFKDEDAIALLTTGESDRTGLYALESVDLFNLLCLPGITNPGVLAVADTYCKKRRAFLIADAPPNVKTPAEMSETISGTVLPKTDHGAVYYPWFYVPDPLRKGKLRLVPPSGTIAGLYARTDSARGIWKAPAGTDANLAGVQAVEYKMTDAENGTLNPLGVNCIRLLPTYGVVAWGARTLAGADAMASEYKYIPIRRLALMIEESLYRGTQWVVFEPNDEPLWAQIRLNLGAFMQNLFRQGAFQGKSPREAYFVKCDKETTTQNDINLGRVNIVVGFAPLKPAEFVIIQLQQIAGQVQS